MTLQPDLPYDPLRDLAPIGLAMINPLVLCTSLAMPADIVAYLNAELIAVLKVPEMREKLAAAGLEPVPGTADEFASLIRSEIRKYAKLIRTSGIRLE